MASNDDSAAFGMLFNALGGGAGLPLFPPADAEDLASGAEYIPDQVTDARRDGQEVVFVKDDGRWHWKFPDGTTVHH